MCTQNFRVPDRPSPPLDGEGQAVDKVEAAIGCYPCLPLEEEGQAYTITNGCPKPISRRRHAHISP